MAHLQRVNDGAVPQLLHVLLGLVEVGLLLHFRGQPLYQLHKVVAVYFVHDPKPAPAMNPDAFQIHPLPREGLSCQADRR